MVILADHEDCATTSSAPASLKRKRSEYLCYDQYDVFLSFRGSDTRNGFTDHLYKALKDADIRTFRDDNELEKGEPLKQQLEKAIRESSVSIIVFSQNYASSPWCLDELVRILEQKKVRGDHYKVLPIFYLVDPSDVRHQKGSYGKAFNQHQQKGRVSLEKINGWKAALTEASNLVGLTFNIGGPETEFIHKCLSTVLKNLPKCKALDVPEFKVAMDDHIRTNGVASWFEDRSKDKVLLISGMGGMGKTTIAKHFFNKYFRDFGSSCFLARISVMWDQIGVCALQRQLLSNILNKKMEEIRVYNCDEGTEKIKRTLCNKKVLLVFDDVSETEQLDALLGQSQRFCPGSKILVTTRNMSLQKDFIVHPKVQNITGLFHKESLELFSWHAFRQCHPPEEYLQLSRDILLRCEGLPLALIVLGSSLRKKLDIFFWKKQLKKWDEIANPSIQKVMEVSFDSLEDEMLKNLFLDVACFFVGEEEDYVVRILDHCGLHATVGIQSLIDRCLITTYDKKLMMHQVIHDMGREIVRQECPNQPERRSRLWYHEDSFTVLKYDKGTEAIQGLILDGQKINKVVSDGPRFAPADANPHLITKVLGYAKKKTEEVLDRFLPSKEGELKMDAFSKMINLKLVNLNHVYLSGSCNKFPKKLRWISWHGSPQEYVPMELPLQNLVALDLQHSRLKEVWKGLKEVKSLKFLNLSYSLELRQTPDFGGIPQLERLILRGCSNLVKVCKTIGILNGLVLLDLADCKSLRDLPDLPESILTLDLSGCSHLEPPNITVTIKLLPRLPLHIVSLSLKGCNRIDESFPSSFSQLSSLEKLDLSGNLITRLPDCIRDLPNSKFHDLIISDCPQLQSVIHPPSTLANLILERNRQLQETVVSMNDFGRLSLRIDERTDYVEIKGFFKGVQARNVERKVIKNLGLKSMTIRFKGVLARNVERKVIKNLGLKSVPIGCVGKVQYEYGYEVIPVFYRVDAPDVMYQRGNAGPVLFEAIIQALKAELTEAANFKGFNVGDNPPETVMICRILSEVKRILLNRRKAKKDKGKRNLGLLALPKCYYAYEWDAEELHLMNDKQSKLPAQLSCRGLVKLFLQGNTDLMEIPLSFFDNMPMLKVLDLSNTSLKCLPSTIGKLVALQEFFLRDCQLLIQLPPEIGQLTNLKVLDVEGTKLIYLPCQIGQLLNLECLKVSFYGYADCYKECNGIKSIVPHRMLSELIRLKELSIIVDPEGKWWSDEVEATMNDLGNIQCLESLTLSMPRADILQQFLKLTRALDGSLVHSSLSNFALSIGHHGEYTVPRVPQGLQEEFKKLQKYLGFTNGEGNTDEIDKILKHASALFLDRHWTAGKLSEFTIDALDRLKFCLVAVCNEMVTIIDGDDYYNDSGVGQPVLQSLQYLCVRHMKSLETVWKGPAVPGCLSHLKILALHVCPKLATVLTKELLANLKNLTVIIIENCPEIASLVTLEESQSLEPDCFLPSLKKITLLNLPKLVSISGGICIALNLERMVIYGCPKLESLSIKEVSIKLPKEIKGEREWWEALNSKSDDHLKCVFIPFGDDDDDDLVDELEEAADSLQQFKQVEDTEFLQNTRMMKRPAALR